MNAANQAKVERFWQRMMKVVGVIPIRVIGLMDLLQLSASEALATDNDWGTSVLEDIRNDGEGIFEEACKRGLVTNGEKYDIFGRHENDLRNFRLTGSEMSSINAIAKMVQVHGILHFIDETEEGPGRSQVARSARPTVAGNATSVPVEVKTSLITRLSEYYKNHVEFNFRPNAFDNLPMSLEWQDGENIRVKPKCVRCAQTIGCTKMGNKWNISNYTQHVRRKHRPKQTDGTNSRSTRNERWQARQDRADGDRGDDDGFETIQEEVINGGDVSEDSEVDNDLPEGAAEEDGCVSRSECVEPRDTAAKTDTATVTEEGYAEVVLVANPARDGKVQPRRVISTVHVDLISPGEGCSKINSGN